MAFNEELAQRLRAALKSKRGITEKRMFGGVAFLLNGNMSVGVNKNDMIVRVDAEQHDGLLKRSNTRTFDLTGKPMKGWILVEAIGLKSEKDLKGCVEIGIRYAASLPKK